MSQTHATYIESHILRRFNIIKKVGSGAYGHVWKVEEKATKKILALKKIFDAFQHATDAQRTYREIEILRQTEHPNIIKLQETVKANNNKDVYLIFEFMEADLHNVISQGILKEVHIKFIIYQLAKSLKYLHTGSIIHRDLKPSNILINSNCTIKLCDFGLVRSLVSKNENNPVLTEGVATRWYRAPQVLLGSKSYSTPADIWSFGCIIFQILQQQPLFAGNSTLDQIQKICSFTGYPSEEDIKSIESEVSKSMINEIKIPNNGQSSYLLKNLPDGFASLLQKMLVFNPKKRITIQEILNHNIVKMFHKKEEQICCNKEIRTEIDDNHKFSVDQYRKLIYGCASNNHENGDSAKYLKKPSILTNKNSQLSKSLNNSDKPQLMKKYSYEKFKSTSINVDNNNMEQNSSMGIKKPQKQTLKYVRSSKQFSKGNDSFKTHQQHSSQQRISDTSFKNQQQTIQDMNKPSYIAKTFYSPKNYLQHTKSSSNHISGNWGSPKVVLNKQLKEKSYLFKSPKYISKINKTEVTMGNNQYRTSQ